MQHRNVSVRVPACALPFQVPTGISVIALLPCPLSMGVQCASVRLPPANVSSCLRPLSPVTVAAAVVV